MTEAINLINKRVRLRTLAEDTVLDVTNHRSLGVLVVLATLGATPINDILEVLPEEVG